jgi:hypothetical protein
LAGRRAAIVAGLAGLASFWAELAPQRYGFEDTDNPATGLAFVTAHPDAWFQGGLALVILGVALILTVLASRRRLSAINGPAQSAHPDLGVEALSVLGLVSAAMFLGMGIVRWAGGPMLYVRGLDQGWGETVYLITQFVGVQLLLIGGVTLLAAWIVGAAWIGSRRGLIPRPLAVLAILPGVRLLALPGVGSLLPDGAWLAGMAAIPAAFLWLVLLGLWGSSPLAVKSPSPRMASL